jgi:outer membrane protein assembly factor BamA
VRERSPGGRTTWDRLLLDIRSYNRISPDANFNLRLVAGGWLSGDELPLQRRFGLGGPATLPGYDFRRLQDRFGGSATDVLTCSNYTVQNGGLPVGTPGECERFAMAQVELRGDMGVDLFGILDGDRDWRRNGWGRGAQWVLFADAGRGWLVGTPDDTRTFSQSALPPLKSFKTDVGVGLQLDELGLYLAKSLSDRGAPVNFFVRLRPRF